MKLFHRLHLFAAAPAFFLGAALRAEAPPLVTPTAAVAVAELPAAGDAPQGALGGELPTGANKSDDARYTPPSQAAVMRAAETNGTMGGFNILGATTAQLREGSNWRLPVPGYITSPFGKVRMLPVYRYRVTKIRRKGHFVSRRRRIRIGRYRHVHKGIDLKAYTGDAVKAVAAGTVAYAGRAQGYGNCVYIDHADGLQTRYAHASQLLVQTGETVTAGEMIARAGSTGRSTGPHLHFEIRRYGEAINPLPYLEEAKIHEEEGGEGDDSAEPGSTDSGDDTAGGSTDGVDGGVLPPANGLAH